MMNKIIFSNLSRVGDDETLIGADHDFFRLAFAVRFCRGAEGQRFGAAGKNFIRGRKFLCLYKA